MRSDKKATPTAKNVAKAHDVKIEAVESSGGRVTKQDVLNAAAPAPHPGTKAPKPQAPKPQPGPVQATAASAASA